MSRIRARDTKPEVLLRRGLHHAGLRFRLHARGLPGRPDIVFSKHHAVILVHGCFWHGHGCPMFRLPATRPDFWTLKIAGNGERNRKSAEALLRAGWRVLTVWERSLKGPARLRTEDAIWRCAEFVRSESQVAALSGCWSESIQTDAVS
jgi:DNA mismatch endonuclease, patch repair protein